MFDPKTGIIDHAIAKQWEQYDLKKVLEKTGPAWDPNYKVKFGYGLGIWMDYIPMYPPVILKSF